MKTLAYLNIFITLLILTACSKSGSEAENHIVIFERGKYPHAVEHNGTFYFLMQSPLSNFISLRRSPTLENIGESDSIVILDSNSTGMQHIWSPEMCRINNNWYIYFEADDGNTDNHQIYVLENTNDIPTDGKWTLHGPIITNSEWNFGIHPSSIVVNDKQYLLWSGWEHRRAETETQCIFIAEMKNPWTLKSQRTLLSTPEYEWERQWINPDATRAAYPIFVNENPEAFLSPDGKKIIVTYSASGIWTHYNSLGMLYASTDSDLLDVSSWTKMQEPSFKVPDEDNAMFGTSNISVVTTTSGESKLIYEAKEIVSLSYAESYICLKSIGWNEASLPVFGSPR